MLTLLTYHADPWAASRDPTSRSVSSEAIPTDGARRRPLGAGDRPEGLGSGSGLRLGAGLGVGVGEGVEVGMWLGLGYGEG